LEAFSLSRVFVFLVGNNRRTKRQTKKKELTPMKTVIKTSIGAPFLRLFCILTAIALGLLALCPRMQAVSPPPDGGYPGQNTAEGQSALLHLAGGTYDTALGWASLGFNVSGNFNTGVGAASLLNNTADNNTATGAGTLLSNTTGDSNTANGAFALFSNTGGSDNTANGMAALQSNTEGSDNTATGTYALFGNTTGFDNTAVGTSALASNVGGNGNVAIGDHTLDSNESGFHNVVLGSGAGYNIIAGGNNIYIGYGISANGAFDESNAIRIKDSAPQVGGTTSKVFVAGIDGSTVGATNAPVLINPNGQLGTGVSSARFKKDIDPMGKTSEAILSLKPVTFHYKGDETNVPQFGLIAEEVAKVNPALILVDKEGRPYSVRYEQVNAMLLNEFLKEHKRVTDLDSEAAKQDATITELKSMVTKQEAMIVRQQKAMEAFTVQLKEQDARIQKVSVELHANKPAPQMVMNP
jgi:uncharacterized coiled-coil protein SlyX